MKTFNNLLLASAVAVSFTFATAASASEVFLSPRAQANQISRVSGTNNDRNLVSGWYAGAAAKSPFRDLRGVQYEIAPLIEKRNASQK